MLRPDEARTVWVDATRDLEIVARGTASPALIAQIERTRFGTEGLRYRRLDVAGHLERLDAPAFLELRSEGALAGTYVLSRAALHAPGEPAQGVYRGLLTVREDLQGRGLGRTLVEQALAWVASGAAATGRRTIAYGCVERRNSRSHDLLASLGCREAGSLHTLGVYRQWPRRRLAFETLEGAALGDALEHALEASHADCPLRRRPRPHAPYAAVTGDDRVLAGAAPSVHRVDLGALPGPWDAFDRWVMRRVPAARRRFDPRRFAYLRLDDVVVLPGHAHLWPALLTSLLAAHGLHTAMFVLDPRSRAHALLDAAGLFGRVTRAMRQEIVVLAHVFDPLPATHEVPAGGPVALAPVDM